MADTNGTDYGFLVRQNSELLRALEEMEKTCATLKEENSLLRKSSCPETEEKVKRLRRKNTELAVIAKRLEERARKLQEANLKVVNAPMPVKPGAVEQYKRAFARQRARDLAQHADALLCKEKQIAALQRECRQLEARLGPGKGGVCVPGSDEIERLLKESQKEVLRLQRQLSVTSAREQSSQSGGAAPEKEEKAAPETPSSVLDEAPAKGEETPGEGEESGAQVTQTQGTSFAKQEEQTEEQRLQLLESELSKKRKECEGLEHEVRKRQKRCQDLESQLEDERSRNEQLAEEAELLRRKVQLLDQLQCENVELKEELSAVSAQHSSVLEENHRLRAKLENLEQVLKHMREVAERRQQLELEHEQALAILKFKQDEIKRLQRAQLFAKREHEGVVQMLEELIHLVLRRELSKVRELEEKCRSQSEQFGLLSQELDKFRLQASKIDLTGSALLSSPTLTQLTNGVGLPVETGTSASWEDIAFWSLEGTEAALYDQNDLDIASVLRTGSTPHAAELARPERSPAAKHRELPTISAKQSSSSSPTPKSDPTHLSPKSAASHPPSPRKASPSHDVDTASEVEELDIDVTPAPYTASRAAAKLQVFIARYSYNPYDGPNDNPEVELPLTAGEYIYVYGDMDDDGFYEGELMDGRRGLVPSNFVERVSDDDIMNSQPTEAGDLSHNSFQDSSLHSGSERFHQRHLRFAPSASERTEASTTTSAPADPNKANSPTLTVPITNGLDLDLEEVGVDSVPYPRKLTLIKQLAKSIIIGWDPPLVPAGWGSVYSYNVFVDQELRLNVAFGAQTKAVLERLDLTQKTYRVAVQSLTEKGNSDLLRCSMLVGRDVSVAPSQLRVDRVTATSASLTWLPSNSNYVHIVSLNDEECELVKAGCYILCLSNLTPNQHYRVKVEARPHRTPWELSAERRECRSAVTTFTTSMAGPPDAPLDVQLEQGPSPGIAVISWLPVTIDAAGTSNGVPVTGYTIYADKKKVLEVASPTAGSALIGPSQIETLKSARELTVRTMSPHGESSDSVPVNVPAKLSVIMTGTAPPLPCLSVPAFTNVASATSEPVVPVTTPLSAAKLPVLPHSSPVDAYASGPVRGAYANTPKSVTVDAPLPASSYVEAWANPSPIAPLTVAMAVQEPPLPPPVQPTQTVSSIPQVSSVPLQTNTPALVPEQARETDSPGVLRPVISISDFLEDPRAKLHTPEPRPNPPKINVPAVDLLNPPDTHPLRPPNPSPLESEPEDDRENVRLVSIEEFLGRPGHSHRSQGYGGGGVTEPPVDYQAESSRGSDLSDILEEEEEDLCSESAGEVQGRGYGMAPTGREVTGRDVPLAEAGATWCAPREHSPKLARSDARLPRDSSRLIGDNEVRIFVALFPYDPVVMSPNPDAAEEELPFKEGQIIKVYGDKDADGFYRGESGGRHGFVPCNMVSEIQVDDEETRDQLLQQGFLSTEATMEKIGTRSHAQLPRRPVPPPKPRRSKKVESAGEWEDSSVIDSSSQDPSRSAVAMGSTGPRRMVAIFDYDPRESSPNADIEAELTFSAGDIIYVFGDMDDDGFFYGDLNGHKGLVPSNFLQPFPETGDEASGGPVLEPSMMDSRRDSQVSHSTCSDQTDPLPATAPEEVSLAQPEPEPEPEPDQDHRVQEQGPSQDAPLGQCPPMPPPSSSSSSSTEHPTLTDTSPPGKKRKGFFSKGKKLLKKLGSSSKKE
ncbi:peripheral-type benzodiazepine receptor-associated protein 1 [Chanos chanos]|uniref:RIMS-binding protein 2 n=1 Tax=Chanos chanos TaxID=29144 RepID=A0A6J2WWZ9_CHACN|nr:peripheral-type benzodiazepine receptor-associated protein 1 [Chanos chanos]